MSSVKIIYFNTLWDNFSYMEEKQEDDYAIQGGKIKTFIQMIQNKLQMSFFK